MRQRPTAATRSWTEVYNDVDVGAAVHRDGGAGRVDRRPRRARRDCRAGGVRRHGFAPAGRTTAGRGRAVRRNAATFHARKLRGRRDHDPQPDYPAHPGAAAAALRAPRRHHRADARRHRLCRHRRRLENRGAAARDRRRPVVSGASRSAPGRIRAAARPVDGPATDSAPRRPRAHLLGDQRVTDTDRDGLLTAIRSAVAAAPGRDSAMKQAVALLKDAIPHYSWVGIYVLEGNELVLGPYLGKPSPHTRIPLGRGICGAAASEKATIVVDDVNADPRYLACSIETRSEIVVPIMLDGQVFGEIYIDSDQPAAFGVADRALLEPVAAMLADRFAEELWHTRSRSFPATAS